MYPPSGMDVPIRMNYPSRIPPEKTFAIGQEMFGIIPGLTMYATLWLREHNRVCDILKAEHPTWDDEQLFQTSRLIIIGEKGWTAVFLPYGTSCLTAALPLAGETIKIVIEEYVQQLSGYLLDLKFDPAMLFNTQFQYGNRIALEFTQLYHWHPLMPDRFLIDGDEVLYEQFLYNTSVLIHYGVDKMVEAFSLQAAGQVTYRFTATWRA